jgi:hypothetical protein
MGIRFRSVLLLLLWTSRESFRGLIQAARIGAAPARQLLASTRDSLRCHYGNGDVWRMTLWVQGG